MPESQTKSPARRFAIAAFAASAAMLIPASVDSRTVSIPFSPAHFSSPLIINNPLFPLVVGKTYTFRSATDAGCEVDRVVVTNHSKHIAIGVSAREVHDSVYAGATCAAATLLTEDTLDYYAQDDSGNVWYLGESSKECDASGCVPSDGSWEAGADPDNIGTNGVPGIIMLAHPRKSDTYRQEYYPGHAEDQATVEAIDIDVTLTRPDAYQPNVFHHCIKTKEFSALESGSPAYKYSCPGFGTVMEDEKGSHTELVSVQ
jgi:hypothetical protein